MNSYLQNPATYTSLFYFIYPSQDLQELITLQLSGLKTTFCVQKYLDTRPSHPYLGCHKIGSAQLYRMPPYALALQFFVTGSSTVPAQNVDLNPNKLFWNSDLTNTLVVERTQIHTEGNL